MNCSGVLPTRTLDSASSLFTRSGDLVALAKKDGTILWKRKAADGIFTDPVAYDDLIIAGETQGKLLFLNATNGEVVGFFEPGRGVFSRPSIFENLVYFISGEGNVYGLRAKYENKASIYYLK